MKVKYECNTNEANTDEGNVNEGNTYEWIPLVKVTGMSNTKGAT